MSLTIPIFNIRLHLSFWFFALIAFALHFDRHVLLWYIALPVAVHELGHMLVMMVCKVELTEIHLTPVSIRMTTRSRDLSYSKELAVAMGGIITNLLLALYLWLFAFQSMRTMLMVASNLAVAAFNLLPVGNLDGGRIVGLICNRYFLPNTAYKISNLVGFIVLVPLCALAGFMLLSGGNFTLALICGYLGFIVAGKQ